MRKVQVILLLMSLVLFSCVSAQSVKDGKKTNSINDKESTSASINTDVVILKSKMESGKRIVVELKRIKFPYDNEFFIKWYVDWDLEWIKPKYLVLYMKVIVNDESQEIPSILRYRWLDPHKIWIENVGKDSFVVYIEGSDNFMSYKQGLLFKNDCLEEIHYYDLIEKGKPEIKKLGCKSY